MRLAIIVLTFPLTLFLRLESRADECNPTDLLVRDEYVLDRKIETELSIFESKEMEKKSDERSSLGFSYRGVSFDAKTAKVAASRLKELLDIDYSFSAKESLFQSVLSDNALAAYIACINKRDEISHEKIDRILEQTDPSITINWHARNRPEPAETVAELTISGGVFSANKSKELQRTIVDRQSIDVSIERNVFDTTVIKVRIKGQPHEIVLPAKSRYEINQETLSSNPSGDPKLNGAAKTKLNIGYRWGKEVCAQIPNSETKAVMVPGGKRAIFVTKNFNNVNFLEEWQLETPKGVCYKAGCKFYEATNNSSCDLRYDVQIDIWKARDISKDN
jgi:hypothetical protein